MEWLSKIPNWVKIPIKILLPALAIFSGFIVLTSDNVLEYLNLLEFEQQNGFAFAIIFLVCVSLILCYIISYFVDIFAKQIRAYLLKKKMYKKFINLQDVYKNTLIQIYRKPTKSLKMEMSNSIAAYLTNIQAIGRSEISDMGYIFDYFLQPWVVMSIERVIEENRKHVIKLEKTIPKIKDKDVQKRLEEDLKVCRVNLEYLTTTDKSDDLREEGECKWIKWMV